MLTPPFHVRGEGRVWEGGEREGVARFPVNFRLGRGDHEGRMTAFSFSAIMRAGTRSPGEERVFDGNILPLSSVMDSLELGEEEEEMWRRQRR